MIEHLAAAAFLHDLKQINPQEIVMLGDHLDCGGFLAQHHTLSYVAESKYSFAHDIMAANEFLDHVQKNAPRAKIHMLCGNHERRIERWIVTQVLRNEKDAKYLNDLLSPEIVMHIAERGIQYYKEEVFHHGLAIRGTIKLGRCHFTHGSTAAKHAAARMVDIFGGSVVFGHTHRAQTFIKRTVKEGAIGAWNPGCLCQIQPYYGLTGLTDWSHGYGLQLVNKDGTFLHINVPIVDGKSYMVPLVIG